MGSFLSFNRSKDQPIEDYSCSGMDWCRKAKTSANCDGESNGLIPGLPDEISLEIIARVPRICYLKMKMVSRSWKVAIGGPEVYRLRKEIGRTEEWLYILTKLEDQLIWHGLDPSSGRWQRVPQMPAIAVEDESPRGFSGLCARNLIDSSIKITETIRGWVVGSDASTKMPFGGCSVGAVGGCLYVLGGFSRFSAIKCVWRYDPRTNSWQESSPMTEGRAFCKISMLDDKLYAVGGIRRVNGGLSPLQSAEVYDPLTNTWTEMPSVPFSKAQVLPTAFLAELLKPVATSVTSYKGRLCVPQSLYSWPLFGDISGEIYDPGTNTWSEMPAGMGEGWPGKQAETKLSAVVNGELYALDPAGSSEGARIKVYDDKDDAWKVVIGKVPFHVSSSCETPYLLATFQGKLHLIMKGISNDTSVLTVGISSSSASFLPSLNPEKFQKAEDPDFWEVIGTKNFGAAEFISCEVLSV
ncbi:F-box/kelch-repeat protein At1g22040-like [Zingiber officinale]|uniref:F-box domain-containing protein n=1 Tax=Zingiber officinale TaxID=94328 RepID=A0A8J5KCB3_ZINOF|nr:F-box/kelch-repeat protein At1g22040-like [Zingiber officinale]XP_042438498.1 F-box/kelch-repeat protein At1g22040-like [Zingiber officinale]KAG6477466.1 hypothetical protein ZIOFF_066721 [Zingiber officinale]